MSVLIIGDVHFPFQHKEALGKIVAHAKSMKPDCIVQIGDLYDFYAFSKYPRSLNVMTPADEVRLGYEGAKTMWKDLQKASPGSECFQMLGNHDERVVRKLIQQSPEFEEMAKEWLEVRMTFPDVTVVREQEFFLNGVCYMHGFRNAIGDHARYNQVSTVVGHSHRGGVVFEQNAHGTFFELNVGWVGDKFSPVFSYQSQKRISKTTLGFGIIDELGPRFCPLE